MEGLCSYLFLCSFVISGVISGVINGAINNDGVIIGKGIGSIINGQYTGDGDKDASHSHYQSRYWQNWKNGKCIQEIRVSGLGVIDSFSEKCSRNIILASLSSSNYMALGDPTKSTFALFSDTYATLVVIKDGQCTLRVYTTINSITTSTTSNVDQPTCNVVKQVMADEFERHRVKMEEWTERRKSEMLAILNGSYNSNQYANKEDLTPPPLAQTGVYKHLIHRLNLGSGANPTSQPPFVSGSTQINIPIATTVNSDTQSTSFLIKTSLITTLSKSGRCMVEVSVVGRGVQDTFNEPCLRDKNKYINQKDIMIYGNPNKDDFCLYSDARNSLVIIRKKVCSKKLYRTVHGVTTSTRSPVSISMCTYIKRKMVQTLEKELTNSAEGEVKIEIEPSVTNTVRKVPANNLENLSMFMTVSNKLNHAGVCQYEVIVWGRGVNDKFLDDCTTTTNDMPELRANPSPGILAIGFPSKTNHVFSDAWGKVVVVSKGKCTVRSYETVNSETIITSSSVGDTDCTAVKHKLDSYLKTYKVFGTPGPSMVESFLPNVGSASASVTVTWRSGHSRTNSPTYNIYHNRNNIFGRCEDEFTVLGKGINDQFKESCVSGNVIRRIRNDKLLVLADVQKYFFLYSDEPSILVVVRDAQCTRRTYEIVNQRTKISSAPLTKSDCSNVIQKMSTPLAAEGVVLDMSKLPGLGAASTSSPISTIATVPANKLVDLSMFMTILNKLNNAGKCQYEVTVWGRGVNDKFLDDCSTNVNDGPEMRANPAPGVLAIGFPSKTNQIFSDTWGKVVVVIKGKCTVKSYETVNSETKITFSSMSDTDCTSVKEKLNFYLKTYKASQNSEPQMLESNPSNGVSEGSLATVTWRPADSDVNLPVFITHHNKLNNNGECQSEITLCGRGVNDRFIDECWTKTVVPEVRAKGLEVIVLPTKNNYVFSEHWGKVVLIRKGKCFERSYETLNSKTKIISRSMEDAECTEVKQRMNSYLNSNGGSLNLGPLKLETSPSSDVPEGIPATVTWRPVNPRADLPAYDIFHKRNYHWGECEDQFTVLGKGLNDLIKRPCVSYDDIRKITNDKQLVIANLKRYSFVFSYEPSSLVIIKDKVCTKKRYETVNQQTKISSTPLPGTECYNVVQKMSKMLNENGVVLDNSKLPGRGDVSQNPAISDRLTSPLPAVSGVNSKEFSVFNIKVFNGGKCEHAFTIAGRGVNDVVMFPCSDNDFVRKFIEGDNLALLDPSSLSGVYTNKWGELMVNRNRMCFKRTYKTGNGQTKITSVTMEDDDCALVMKEINERIRISKGL